MVKVDVRSQTQQTFGDGGSTFLSTLLLILYPSQPASDDSGNDFINNLFNSSGGGSIGDDS
jgi:hypothetical protein